MRGYNVGELAACRRFAEAAAELRVPLLGQQVFAFAEFGSDLGSSGQCSTHTACQHLPLGQRASASKGAGLVRCPPMAGWLASWPAGWHPNISGTPAPTHPPTH